MNDFTEKIAHTIVVCYISHGALAATRNSLVGISGIRD